jgi:hypothetical protein
MIITRLNELKKKLAICLSFVYKEINIRKTFPSRRKNHDISVDYNQLITHLFKKIQICTK